MRTTPRRSHRSPRATRRGPRGSTALAATAAVGLLLTACSGESGAPAAPEPHRTPFDAANFVDPTTSTNTWFPLRPGTQWVREGTTEVGSRPVPHQVITTMTDVIRMIDGVPTVAMIDQETDAGQISQVSIDYFGLDRDGNVWLLGGYTEAFEGGQFTNSVDAWLGPSANGDPGILVPTNPDLSTPRWFVGENRGEEGSAAEVAEVGASQCVPFACYDNVLVVREGKISAIDNEFKFYAPGVGLILNSPRKDSKHKDTESLVNLTELSPTGLTELSNEVLQLEAHARTTEPDIFGPAPESTRSG